MLRSTNGLYQIDPTNPSMLLSASDNIGLNNFINRQRTREGHIVYTPRNPLSPNDCLQFSESLSKNEVGYSGNKCILKEKITKLAFGWTYDQNIRIADTAPQNFKANPDIGESYAIVRTDGKGGEVPYHIAYVIAKDGSTNITLEADAGNPDLRYPVFDMYDTVDPAKSFHARYSKIYKPGATIVLMRR